MTDDLIASLAADLQPIRPGTVSRRIGTAVAIALAASALVMLALLGLRPDLASAIATPIFWVKFGYTLAISLFGLVAMARLSRPGGTAGAPFSAAIAAFGIIAVFSATQVGIAPSDARRALIMGSSALLCPFYIVGLSLPFLIANLVVVRRLAPTNLPLAGLAAGLLAGALGAWVYAFHCTEEALPFLALWYTLGILATATIGAALGRYALRW